MGCERRRDADADRRDHELDLGRASRHPAARRGRERSPTLGRGHRARPATRGRRRMSTRALTPTLVVLAAALAAGCWGGGDAPASGQAAQPLPASVCSRVVYGGPGPPRVLLGLTGWVPGEDPRHRRQTG